jgi:hypothetical protein
MRRRLSLATRKELIEAVRKRYQEAALATKTDILDEFVEGDRLSPETRSSASWAECWAERREEVALGNPHLQRCGARSIDSALGGCRSHLRQAIKGPRSALARSHGEARPFATGDWSSRSVAADERRHDRSATYLRKNQGVKKGKTAKTAIAMTTKINVFTVNGAKIKNWQSGAILSCQNEHLLEEVFRNPVF